MLKSMGTDTDPCETLNFRLQLVGDAPSITTACFLSVRYDLNHARAVPVMQSLDCNLETFHISHSHHPEDVGLDVPFVSFYHKGCGGLWWPLASC